jgi:hypothetical protein
MIVFVVVRRWKEPIVAYYKEMSNGFAWREHDRSKNF